MKTLRKRSRLTYAALLVLLACAAYTAKDIRFSNRMLAEGMADPALQALIDADAPAIDLILESKRGSFCVDPYAALYKQRYPAIRNTLLSGKDLARFRDMTLLADASLDGSNTFMTQGFLFAEISEAHAVYTNDTSVIERLREEGYEVNDYYSREQILNLANSAESSYLSYDPAQGIVLDRVAGWPENPWSGAVILHTGAYEATFICRLPDPASEDPRHNVKFAVNYAWSDEIASETVHARDAGKDGHITVTVPFYVHGGLRGIGITFSVYGGDMDRMIVEEIRYVRRAQ